MPKAEGKRRSQNPLERARDAGLDSLFEVHPKGFIAARTAVADALKKSGDAEAAGAVRSMSKPTVPVWVVNQVARRKAAEVEALLEVSTQLRRAQGGKAGDFRALSERHRELVRTLRGEAARVLELSPTSTSANLDRAEQTLLAAAAGTESQREQLQVGELREELVAAGFDVFGGFGGGFAPAPAPAAPKPGKAKEKPKKAAAGSGAKPSAAEAKARAREEARARAEAERQARQAERESRAAAERASLREQLDRAEREAAALEGAVTQAEAALTAANEALDAAQARQAEARQALKLAQGEHRKAEAEVAQLKRKTKANA